VGLHETCLIPVVEERYTWREMRQLVWKDLEEYTEKYLEAQRGEDFEVYTECLLGEKGYGDM
jgi:hypothetical protein